MEIITVPISEGCYVKNLEQRPAHRSAIIIV